MPQAGLNLSLLTPLLARQWVFAAFPVEAHFERVAHRCGALFRAKSHEVNGGKGPRPEDPRYFEIVRRELVVEYARCLVAECLGRDGCQRRSDLWGEVVGRFDRQVNHGRGRGRSRRAR